MFNAVLTPLDGSPESARALGPAETIADALGVPLSVKAYCDNETDGLELERDVRGLVDDICTGQPDVEVSAMTEPVFALLAPYLMDHRTLVVMSTRGYGRAAALVGSVATDIVANSHGPVMLIGPACDVGRFDIAHHLVVATDAGPESAAALALARELVATFDMEPVVVNVADPKTDRITAAVRSGPGGNDLPPDSAVAHRFAQELQATAAGDVDYEVLHSSHRGRAIAAFATEVGASMIAMTTQARTGFARLALGSITSDVLSYATCPVIAVAPEDQPT